MTGRRDAGFDGTIGRTIAGSRSWWPERPKPAPAAPNVVVILLDDMGFSDIGCFGSEISTPAIDGLADRGVRFTNFHVTPLSSPTRASLLTGLNHHKAGYGLVANGDPGVPNRRSAFPADVATLPETLRDQGYATFAVGKWHLAPEAEMHDAASREMWPCQVGFDRYYGFLDALTSPHNPHRLISDNSPIDIERYPEGYYITDDLTDKAIEMIRANRANDPDRPFFLYLGHAAVHGPLQAKAETIDRYRDFYQAGWDRIRESRFARQLELGLFPPDTRLPAPDRSQERGAPAWDELPPERRELYARMMSVYAAMIDSVDESTQRIVGTLEEMGELDNTLFVFFSDNGAAGEGGLEGDLTYTKLPPLVSAPLKDTDIDLDLVGSPRMLMHYPRGWAIAGNTPFRLYKATTHEGGVRSPLIVSWPAGLREDVRGGVRRQFHYVTDLLPTILELAGVPLATERSGKALRPIDGSSLAATLRDAAIPTTHSEQYEETYGHRSYYRSQWKAVTLHKRQTRFDDDHWELYDLEADPTEIDDLAGERPGLVEELKEAWEAAAQKNQVYPLNEGSGLAEALTDPAEERLNREVTLYPGTPTLERYRSNCLIHNRSFTVEMLFHFHGDAGIIVAHGGQGGGYAVYVEDGVLRLAWNEADEMHDVPVGPLSPGEQVATLEVEVHEGRICDARLLCGGAEARLQGLFAFSGFGPIHGIDVGIDRRSPVSWPVWQRHGPFPYTGTIQSVTYRPGEPAPDAPERRIEDMREAGLRFE
ncbi:MAG: arylsulfatase [Thermoleophilia bacterium]|nr:arylsulfatase [Thermoleophilia bacterium]